jgi:hypothetical protein
MEGLLSQIKMQTNTYQALSPLKRIKGYLNKVHRMKLSSYPRYLYLNPIEGVLISYNSINKFPHSPNYIIKLNEIIELKMVSGNAWYTKKGRYYFSIKTLSLQSIFYLNNLDLINFWMNEIDISKKFQVWMQHVIDLRYSSQGNLLEAPIVESQKLLDVADELINTILGINVPEVDMD